MRLNSCILGFCGLIGAAVPPAGAAIISGTFSFSASAGGPIDPFAGSFSITFDNSADISDIGSGTTVGITPLTQPAGFTLASSLGFFYIAAADFLGVGGTNAGVFSLSPAISDFAVGIEDVSTATPSFASFTYAVDGVEGFFSTACGLEVCEGGGSVTFTPGITVVPEVPEPASLALLAAGLLGLGAGRTLRRRRAA